MRQRNNTRVIIIPQMINSRLRGDVKTEQHNIRATAAYRLPSLYLNFRFIVKCERTSDSPFSEYM